MLVCVWKGRGSCPESGLNFPTRTITPPGKDEVAVSHPERYVFSPQQYHYHTKECCYGRTRT